MRKPVIGLGFALGLALTGLTTTLTTTAAEADPVVRLHPQKVCADASSPLVAVCHARVMTDKKGAVPTADAPPPGALTPSDVRSAYDLPATGGTGRTVAIVDAFGYPNLERDLAVYRTEFGLPACTVADGCLRVIDQDGGTKAPHFDAGWGLETALDADAVSAACPTCSILVVQAKSDAFKNLSIAVATAATQPGVVAISNSYGFGDLSEATYGAPWDHPGIAVTASTGDSGYQGASFPASSSKVVAVGGTTLTSATSTARGWTETAWSGAGSGCSATNPALAAAASYDTGCANRAIADVAAAADPTAGGLAVYYPVSSKASTWATVGGTSEASPIIAAVYALSGNTGGPGVYANALPYAANGSGLNDVTEGSNGTCSTAQWCSARSGWDGPTGVGTPDGLSAF